MPFAHGSLLIRIVTTALSVGLLFSFGMHSVQIEHEHYGVSHEHRDDTHTALIVDVAEYLHLSDKKFLLLLVLLFGYTVFPTSRRKESVKLVRIAWRQSLVLLDKAQGFKLFDFLVYNFRIGNLHPKKP